ncbi:MAG: hypothetical protein HZB66_02705 [Candidatus Aenigmarchaeota archaeon]|nr:hypothetical protein [Candidatus Aenigmarchaeota archaeon]
MDDPRKLQAVLQELVRRVNNDSRRMRGIEQQLQALETKADALEETILRRSKNYDKKIVEFEAGLRLLNENMIRMNNDLEKVNRQIGKFALKRDIKEMEKMFDLLSPISRDIVTRDQLGKEVEEEVSGIMAKYGKNESPATKHNFYKPETQ